MISNGKLRRGDYFICGDWEKLELMLPWEQLMKLPSTPVEILGMNDSALRAEFVVPKMKKRQKMAEFKKTDNTKNNLSAKDKTTLFDTVKNKDELNIVIKSDVHGSSEALKMAINKIEHKEVEAKIILSDIGMINETDVSLAKASNAISPDLMLNQIEKQKN